ncbi:hypothetical protein NS365_04675 [Aureimonas ureilytica]|uniref:Uncharacterized protein n=1 Tax=Aureimonas ureilytica TaxID=401562 RepID=A0A175RV57_9HYPH|nr:hypothetical protein [Aureimonas ureilytica]KTR07351.1 hypothetical protein NS365_04675 [Aureimonas ureilytica]
MLANSPLFRGDPGRVEIPLHLQASLRRLAERAYRRGNRASLGWTSKDGEPIPADHVSQLALRNLCKVRPASRNRSFDRAELTDLGHEVAAMVACAKREGER